MDPFEMIESLPEPQRNAIVNLTQAFDDTWNMRVSYPSDAGCIDVHFSHRFYPINLYWHVHVTGEVYRSAESNTERN